MPRRRPHELAVHLDSLDQLANDSPFDAGRRWIFEDPAVDYMADELRAMSRRGGASIHVYLPPELAAHPETESRVRQTIALYCRASLRHLENEIGGLKRQAIATSWFGLAILAAVLTLVVLVERTGSLSGAPSTFITEGLLIVGWVAAWFPVDMALYSRWPKNLDKKIYNLLLEAPVEVHADVCAVPGTGSDDEAYDVGPSCRRATEVS
jgi:hypothetical protein